MCSPCLLSRLAFIQAHENCASFWPPISIIRDFTAQRRGGPTPLVAFVDGVSPFSPTFAPAVVWKREGTSERSPLHLRLPQRKKKSKLNGSDNLQTFLAAAAQHSHGHRTPRAHPYTTPATPAHAPAAPSRAFTDSHIIYGRLPTGAPLNALLRKPLMREKAPFLFLLSSRVLWDNIGHYEVWGIFPGTP